MATTKGKLILIGLVLVASAFVTGFFAGHNPRFNTDETKTGSKDCQQTFNKELDDLRVFKLRIQQGQAAEDAARKRHWINSKGQQCPEAGLEACEVKTAEDLVRKFGGKDYKPPDPTILYRYVTGQGFVAVGKAGEPLVGSDEHFRQWLEKRRKGQP